MRQLDVESIDKPEPVATRPGAHEQLRKRMSRDGCPLQLEQTAAHVVGPELVCTMKTPEG